jgi:LmeA-like phospholipid-binding
MSSEPTRPLPEWSNASPSTGAPPPAGKRRRRRPRITWIIVLVILVLLVVSDFAARAYTENQMASQVQSSLGLSGKPKVTIHGFPFWTQLLARDFKNVTVTASNETINVSNAASGLLQISSLNATLDGMHIHGRNSATVDHFTATALVTFTALGNVGGIPSGVTLVPDGPNQIKATVSLFGLFSDSATVQVTQSGPNQINVKVTDFGGIPASTLGNLGNFNITIPKLPAGVTIQSVSVTQQGLQITVTGQNTTLSQ